MVRICRLGFCVGMGQVSGVGRHGFEGVWKVGAKGVLRIGFFSSLCLPAGGLLPVQINPGWNWHERP